MPEELRATVANRTGLPLNWSLMVTLPEVTGVPLAATVTVRGCTHPLRAPAVSVVVEDTPVGNASAGMASAITNPATNTSREARQFMPLTCTCSKDQNRVPPACRSPEPYCIRRGRSGANRRAAISQDKPGATPAMVGRGPTGLGSGGQKSTAGDRERRLSGHGKWEQWYALAILALYAESGESAA